MTPNNMLNSWVNIPSEKLPSPTILDYDTLSASELAFFALNNNSPILDDIEHDEGFEIWSSCSVPPPIKVKRKEGMKLVEWYEYFSDFSGQLLVKYSERDLRCKVLQKGLDQTARPTVWKYLLGIYDFNSKVCDRDLKNRFMNVTYEQYKLEWQLLLKTSMETQDNLYRIQKDVVRTDRHHPYYVNKNPCPNDLNLSQIIDSSPASKSLQDILMTFTTTFPTGEDCFVQGMADLASIILITMKDETSAFWCFVAIMNKYVLNF